MPRPLIAAVAVIALTSLGTLAYVTLRPAPAGAPAATSTVPAADTATSSTATLAPETRDPAGNGQTTTPSPQDSTSTPPMSEQSAATATPAIEHPTPAASTTSFKTYRNEEWGFSFAYPEGWRVVENPSRNYYSQFNLAVYPLNETLYDEPVIVNIVLPEFIENSFEKRDKTTEAINVGGVVGVLYTYQWNGEQRRSVILPLSKNKMIIGGNPHYADLFNQVLTSFRFLR